MISASLARLKKDNKANTLQIPKFQNDVYVFHYISFVYLALLLLRSDLKAYFFLFLSPYNIIVGWGFPPRHPKASWGSVEVQDLDSTLFGLVRLDRT